MKKSILVATVFFTIFFSSVGFASCNLDLNRWEWIATNKKFSVYIDTKTVKSFNDFVDVWVCWYFPSNCQYHTTGGEHYHHNLFTINYRNNTCCLKSFVNRDRNGNVTDSHTYTNADYRPIPPETILESIAVAAKKRINSPSTNK